MAAEYPLPGQKGQVKRWTTLLAWGAVFACAAIAYWPGLEGPFVLDDFTSLGALGNLGGVTDWATFKAYVFGGTAGPTGRPVALASFLIDGNNWPTDPWYFKRTNLVIHMLNAALLGVLTRQILQLLDIERHAAGWLALFSAGAWLLHPFLVSTTLYAVQRMAQLAMLFSLGGLITYLYGRSLSATDKVRAYLIMTISLGLFTVLATYSKENGVLLPLLVGVIEITIVASRRNTLPALDRRWSTVVLAIPSAFVIGYLGYRFFRVDFHDVAGARDFSLYERLLTQPRVLADYLQHWFLPKLYTTGVFQDHVMKSTGLFTPFSTVLGALLHLGLIAFAIVKRRQLPLLGFAILFFYGNHLLESTTLNLELYFEHRNYLATGFLFLPLIVWAHNSLSPQLGMLIGVTVLLALTGFTRFSSTIWSDYDGMVAASARKAPTSARAQAEFAVNLFNAGQYEQSLEIMDRAIANIPTNNPLLLLNRLIIRCKLGVLSPQELGAAADALSSRTYDPRYLKHYTDLMQALTEDQCARVGTEQLRSLFARMLQNPANTKPGSLELSHIKYLIGAVDLQTGDGAGATMRFRESLNEKPDSGAAMTMAAMLATAGYPEAALEISELALGYLNVESRGVRLGLKVSEADILRFRAIVSEELQQTAD